VTAVAEAGKRVPPQPPAVERRRAAHGGAAAGFAPPSRRRDAGTELEHSRPKLPTAAPLVRRPLAWSAWRELRNGDCTGLPRWPPCGVGEEGVEKKQRGCFGVARQWRRCRWNCV